jgi:transmembrane protease serine 5
LSVVDEPGSTAHSVQEIILHTDSVEYDADISVLVLRDPVEYSESVGPICLPQQSDDEVVGMGTVVGWGRSKQSEVTEKQHDSTPNELKVSAVSNSDCFKDVKKLEISSSHRTFCAGFVNKSKSACSGNSGSGFYLLDSSTKLFNLQGIVSFSAYNRDQPTRGCDISAYTNVAKFIDWIRSEIEKTK